MDRETLKVSTIVRTAGLSLFPRDIDGIEATMENNKDYHSTTQIGSEHSVNSDTTETPPLDDV